MARKHLLMGLSDEKLPAGNSTSEPASNPHPTPASGQGPAPYLGIMGTRGAIGAVSRSFEQIKAQSEAKLERLKEQAVVELEPAVIDASFIADRLETDEARHQELVGSIRDHGQQVPILVRPHPEKPDRYQIAYGRRRLRAAAELKQPVRAVIKNLTDKELVVAQGQENSARTDLSFIERAHFAAQLEQGGYGRETIMAALSVDKTGLSRLISSASKIPQNILQAIGPAPKAGRDRWTALADRLDRPSALVAARLATEEEGFAVKTSDDRFLLVFAAAAPVKTKLQTVLIKSMEGDRIAQLRQDEKSVTVSIDRKAQGGFSEYLIDHLAAIYEVYQREKSNK